MTMSPRSLFDEFGRCIPHGAPSGAHARSRRYFVCVQPETDYRAIHGRYRRHLGLGDDLTAEEFQARVEAIHRRLSGNERLCNIGRGVGVPFIIPRMAAGDVGTLLDELFLPSLGDAFRERFPDRAFTNHHKGGLSGKLSVVAQSRHQRLLERIARETVVGVYFPCLLEYSVPAAAEQMAALPDDFLLAGGFDTCAALIGSPDLLLRKDGYPPLLWLSALAAEKAGIGYHFEAYGFNLTFNRRPHLAKVAEYWASGLSVLGET